MVSAKHTPGPWQRSGVRVKLGAQDCLQVGPDGFSIAFLPIGNRPMEQSGAIADANLIAAAPVMFKELQKLTDNAEQAAFEEWLAIVRPSGDVERVQSQWEASSAYEDFYEQWKDALAAIARATGSAA